MKKTKKLGSYDYHDDTNWEETVMEDVMGGRKPKFRTKKVSDEIIGNYIAMMYTSTQPVNPIRVVAKLIDEGYDGTGLADQVRDWLFRNSRQNIEDISYTRLTAQPDPEPEHKRVFMGRKPSRHDH